MSGASGVTVHRSCSSNPVLFESCRVLLMVQGGTSRDDVLKERKHEHSRRRASISRVYKIEEQNFPLFLRAFRYPRSPSSPPITRT
ncbi:hypothetical protein TNCV_4078241 [Trichonephila clavipes]|nr:hypothetical protein TNCV_4078241 [Trichonephila clavipes]